MEGRFHQNFQILEEFEDLHILARGRSEPEFNPRTIYALSSGMMSEHTVSHRFARRILSSPEHALLFVGYADSATPGGKILAAGQGGRIQLNQDSPHETPIECEVHRFDFSGHSPRNQLADYAVKCQPKKVILVHGDFPAKTWFQEELERRLPDSEIIIPRPGEWVE
jgi:predicted metal-dependent RNase